MARIRSIKPEFFTDPDVCALSPLAALLYAGLWCHADRDGRLEDKPRDLALKILPLRNCSVDELLTELVQPKEGRDYGFIQRYAVGGRRYIQVLKLGEHQRFHHKEESRGLPAPPAPIDLGAASPAAASAPRFTPPPPSEKLDCLQETRGQPGASPGPAALVLGAGAGAGSKDLAAFAAPSENPDGLAPESPRPTPPLPEVSPGPTQGYTRASPPPAPAQPPAGPLPPTFADAFRQEQQAKPKARPRAKRPKAPDGPPPDPRHAPLFAACRELFREVRGAKYPGDKRAIGHAAVAVAGLLELGPPDEVLRVYRLALERDEYPTVRTLPELLQRWAHYAGVGPPPPRASASSPPRTAARAAPSAPRPDGVCTRCHEAGEVAGNPRLCSACEAAYFRAIEAEEITWRERDDWVARTRASFEQGRREAHP